MHLQNQLNWFLNREIWCFHKFLRWTTAHAKTFITLAKQLVSRCILEMFTSFVRTYESFILIWWFFIAALFMLSTNFVIYEATYQLKYLLHCFDAYPSSKLRLIFWILSLLKTHLDQRGKESARSFSHVIMNLCLKKQMVLKVKRNFGT